MLGNVIGGWINLDEVVRNHRRKGRNAIPDPADMAWLRWLAADDAAQQADYVTYREYYDGVHNVPLTERQEEYLSRDGVDFRFNYMALPVDVLTQRLKVADFNTGDDAQGGEDGVLWQWWEANRMDAQQKHTYQAAQVDGDTYVLVEWDDEAGMPRFHHEPAYDGEEGVKVHYRNRRGVVEFASKRWREVGADGKPLRRMNIYTPEFIYKWSIGTSGEANWQPYEQDGEAWPLPWPVGVVPVVHFRFNADGSNWGKSLLDDLIPPQQALNKSILDYLEGLDKTAYDVIFVTGTKATDKDGNSIKIEAGSLIGIPQKEAGIHIKPGADLSALRNAKTDFVVTISQLSQIPLQYFQVTGHISAADTQSANDGSLIAKAEDTAVTYGNAWEDMMHIARLIHNEYGSQKLDTGVRIETVWNSFERVDRAEADRKRADTSEIQARTFSALLAEGIERTLAAKLAGYSEAEAAEMASSQVRTLASDEL